MAELLERLQRALADRYAVERELGRGGMATVYLAEESHPQRHVAIKVLDPTLGAVLGPERFLREVDVASKLAHPHILPIYAAAEADGLLYYVMPYVEGESLRDRLNRDKQLPLDDALQISREVADALSYAHAHGVVHRDIKPENILLESGHAVVADFGIARAIDQAGGSRLTETGVTLGTPAYMSPEQAAGSKDLDGRSDLYSLGCVLYEMLAGRPPFMGPTAESVVHQHLAVEPPSITALRPAVPASVAAALTRALAKTPADRFNPVALFAEALGGRASAISPPVPVSPIAASPAEASRSWRRAALVTLAVVVVLAGAAVVGRRLFRGHAAARHPRTAIAVLPLENLSPQGPFAFFAGGLHDELLTQLARVSALTVIGRTSVSAYQGTTKRLSRIAEELAVGSVVEGSVQVVGNRLRVIVQLMDPVTEAHIWAETYDRTLNDAFAVQSDIARRITEAVGATLTSAEGEAIAKAPTGDPGAYQLYLQGLEAWRRPGYLRANWDSAATFFERALRLDPRFALAEATLSIVHGFMYFNRYDPSHAMAERQWREAEAALRLAPDLPRAHQAVGLALYWGRGDYRAALEQMTLARDLAPNDGTMWAVIAGLDRRLGDWDSACAAYQRAIQLGPHAADARRELGWTYFAMRRYPEALDALDRATRISPSYSIPVWRGLIYAVWRGQLDSLDAALGRLPPDADLAELGGVTVQRARLLLWQRRPDSVVALLGRAPERAFEGQLFYLPRSLLVAWAQLLRGDSAAARAAFTSARTLLDSVARVLPQDWRIYAARGEALAGLGLRQEALGEVRWLEQSDAYRKDHFDAGTTAIEARASILARVGDAGAALAEIERLLSGPSEFSVHTFRLDPRWDPIRRDPRFQALLVRYANPGAP